MIPSEHKAEIITTGIYFMRAITEAYGSDEGMRLWDTIATTLDSDIKGEIFFAMLCGTHTNRVKITGIDVAANKISVIKAIRTVDTRRLGLKEAKDISDHLVAGKAVTLEIEPNRYHAVVKELNAVGLQAF
jgi:hypothetical protein